MLARPAASGLGLTGFNNWGTDVAAFEIRYAAEQRQAQGASPRLQHAVRLLQMSSLDFAAAVRDASGRNPFLESDDLDPPPDRDSAADISDDGVSSLDAAGPADDAAGAEAYFERRRDGDGIASVGGLGDLSAMLDGISDEPTLARQLLEQIALLRLSTRERMLAAAIVESLDDDGYLRSPLAELVDVVALDPPASVAELETALCQVQALEPAGVGARDVAECLLLQLPALADGRPRELAQAIISGHLEMLARRDSAGLARCLGASRAEVDAVCERIRQFDPRPGSRFGSARIAYVVPDVIARRERGIWQVRLNPAVVPRLRLNHTYADWFVRHRADGHREMAGLLQDAHWTLRNIEQRFSTVLEVAAAIVRRQRNFLEFGTMAMKPLCLRDIADELGIHESTVSRVSNNKYIATPNGVFELKFFFSRVLRSANGSACSGTAIRGLIGEMIAAEPPGSPLSDAEITRRLAAQGLVVARRTVTKYRQILRIEPIERRCHA
ncbi:RNA polymerase factor sigma-54 [Piscinibacter sakaiensis]|uniref:RNA polymerase factor sigma-54 n=1 Tax=Piscinibacter sakaiensis TaxID=1547922 RepID=UPI003AB07E65